MTCCASGKAIIKYIPYKKGKFRYRLNVGSAWKEINAEENLTGMCEDIVSYAPGDNIVLYYRVERDGIISETLSYIGFWNGWKTPVSYIILEPYGYNSRIEATGKTSSGEETSAGSIYRYSNFVIVGWGAHPSLNPVYKVKFTVKGAETGAEYLILTDLDQCPEVQQEGCQLQPEQKFEIELIQFDASYVKKIPGFSSLPIPTVLTECVVVESAVPLAGAECVVVKKRLGVPYNIFEVIQGVIGLPFESVVKVLCSDPGCPPPVVTVVCGEDKSQECPPETDCEIVCKGFKCCYSKGKVIKVIPV